MKPFTFFLLLLFTIVSCTTKKKTVDSTRTVISGQILNFNELPDYETIDLYYPDVLAGQVHNKITITKNGQFKFVLNLDNSTNAWIYYVANLPVFISKGDSINITIDNRFITNKAENYAELFGHLKVSGEKENMNKEVSEFLAFLEDSIYNHMALNDSLKILDPVPARAFLENELQKQYKILNQFNKQKNTSIHFQNWARNHLKYRTWSILFQYPAFHAYLNKLEKPKNGYFSEIPKQYFNFLDSFENVRNNEFFETKEYSDFLRGYSGYINQIIPQDTIKYYRSLYRKNFEKGFDYFLTYYSSKTDGFLKDLLIANHYYWTLDDQHYNNLKYIANFGQIEDSLLRKKVEKKFYHEQKIYENPELNPDANIDEKVDNNEFLKALKAKYKTKVIFIDFWAPWCKPCMAEIPFAQELKKQYEKEDVVFVYLGTNCKKENWELTIKEKNIKGEHFLLTDKQTKELNDIFDIRGIPHYVLLGKNGKVISKFSPRPSSGEELTSLIDKNLKTSP